MCWKPISFGHKQTFEKAQLNFFFAYLDNATIKSSCCQVSHKS